MISPHERELSAKLSHDIGVSVYKEGRSLDIDMQVFHSLFDQKAKVNWSPITAFLRWFFFGTLWTKPNTVDQLNPNGDDINE